jgi:hypothetical protein
MATLGGLARPGAMGSDMEGAIIEVSDVCSGGSLLERVNDKRPVIQ